MARRSLVVEGRLGGTGWLLAGLVLACGACSTSPVQPTVETTGMPNAELALQRTVAQVDADVGHLGMMQPAEQASAAGIVPAELQKQMTLQWTGPLDGAVRRIADAVGYQLAVDTVPNQKPLSVSFDQFGQAVDILRLLGEQAGTRATVAVDPIHHQITVVHHV